MLVFDVCHEDMVNRHCVLCSLVGSVFWTTSNGVSWVHFNCFNGGLSVRWQSIASLQQTRGWLIWPFCFVAAKVPFAVAKGFAAAKGEGARVCPDFLFAHFCDFSPKTLKTQPKLWKTLLKAS